MHNQYALSIITWWYVDRSEYPHVSVSSPNSFYQQRDISLWFLF